MKAVVVKKSKPLPPWLEKAQKEGAAEGKSGKAPSKAHEKGESAKFEAAEEKAMPRKMADGGKVASTKSTATKPKATAANFKKSAGNAKSAHVLHMKDGGMKGR